MSSASGVFSIHIASGSGAGQTNSIPVPRGSVARCIIPRLRAAGVLATSQRTGTARPPGRAKMSVGLSVTYDIDPLIAYCARRTVGRRDIVMQTQGQEVALNALSHIVEERWQVGERVFDRVAKQVDLRLPTPDQMRELLYEAAESGHHAPSSLSDVFDWCRVKAWQGHAIVVPDTAEVRGLESNFTPGFLEPRATDGAVAYFWPKNDGQETPAKVDAHRRYGYEEPPGRAENWDAWRESYDRYATRVQDDISTMPEIAVPLQLALRGYFQALFPGDGADRVEHMIRSYYVLHAEGSAWTRALINAGRLIDRGIPPYCVLGMLPGSCIWLTST